MKDVGNGSKRIEVRSLCPAAPHVHLGASEPFRKATIAAHGRITGSIASSCKDGLASAEQAFDGQARRRAP